MNIAMQSSLYFQKILLPKLLYYHCIHLNITLWDLYNFILKICSKFLIFLYEDIFYCFRLMESVILFGVAIKPSLVISWWGGEGGLEGWGNISFESFCDDEESEGWDIWWKVLRVNDPIHQPVMIMFSWTVPIQFSPNSGRFPPLSSFLLELLFNYGIW